MSNDIKLKMDYAMPADYQPQYDEQGRFKVFPEKSCPLKANAEDEDAWLESMMPTDEQAGMRNVTPKPKDPYQEVADLALAEALISDSEEQAQRVATNADEIEQKELESMGMLSDEELLKRIRGH